MALVILKVDEDVAELADVGAHQLKMAKKDLVGEAIRVYLEIRREEIRQNMQATLAKLDGTNRSRLALLTGLTVEQIDAVGGISEDL
jgi:hypothetical protein